MRFCIGRPARRPGGTFRQSPHPGYFGCRLVAIHRANIGIADDASASIRSTRINDEAGLTSNSHGVGEWPRQPKFKEVSPFRRRNSHPDQPACVLERDNGANAEAEGTRAPFITTSSHWISQGGNTFSEGPRQSDQIVYLQFSNKLSRTSNPKSRLGVCVANKKSHRWSIGRFGA